MKPLVICILFITTILCAQQKKDNVENFIEKYFLSRISEVDINEFQQYACLNIKEYNNFTDDQKSKFINYVKILVTLEHDELAKYNYTYKIFSHSEVDRNLLENYRLIYNDTSNIYYVVSHSKVITHFILDKNNYVISFAPNIFTSHDGRIEPFMLNKLADD